MLRKLVLIVLLSHKCVTSNEPSVVTNSGKIVGRYLTSFAGKKYEAYQGIPYALPPIGDRRFQPPVPIQPWSGELLANHMASFCCQYNRLSANSPALGSEDCLYLNVFVPKRTTNATLLPVLFWIHGGGFHSGYNQVDEEFYLMDREVVLVTIQYRLGFLGFLSTQDEVVPGNMGLKDQSLALRWVHLNIQNFGGDPQKITLYGQSAGGASVQYHYLSPMSFGLFQNGVSFSGTAFNSWAQAENSRDKALQLGKLMNCTTSDTHLMVQCLRERSAADLIAAQKTFMQSWFSNPPFPFGPVVEKSLVNPFINRPPRQIIESGTAYDVPWITGVVSEEGLFPVALWTDEATLKQIDSNWNDIAPFLLDYSQTMPKDNQTKLAQAIKKQYFGDKFIDKTTFMNLVNLVGNRWYFVDAEKAARVQATANESPVWFYYYSYRAVDSTTSALTNNTDYSGVCHGDDIFLFMKNSIVIPTKSSRDMAMQEVLIDFLISFATNGKPNVNGKWLKVDLKNELNYLSIAGPEVTNISMAANDNFGQKKFWNSINFAENTS